MNQKFTCNTFPFPFHSDSLFLSLRFVVRREILTRPGPSPRERKVGVVKGKMGKGEAEAKKVVDVGVREKRGMVM